MEDESPLMCMWSYAVSTMPVAGIFGGILGRCLARGQAHWYLVGCCRLRGQQPERSVVCRPGPPPEGGDLRMHGTSASRPGGISGEVLRGFITPEGATWQSAERRWSATRMERQKPLEVCT